MEYPLFVERKDGVWRAFIPALAGLSVEGASREEVVRNAQQAAEEYLSIHTKFSFVLRFYLSVRCLSDSSNLTEPGLWAPVYPRVRPGPSGQENLQTVLCSGLRLRIPERPCNRPVARGG